MDYKYKQLEQELSALSKVFTELGTRLSEVAKEVTSPGVIPSEKVLEQISASRTSFENARTSVHAHAEAMLVSPLPRLGELVSIAVIDALLKAGAAAEENKFSIEAEREKALAILGRVLSIAHKDGGEFKPLQECHSKVGELRSAVSNVVWPHRHPDSETIVAARHPTNALLSFIETLDTLDDEHWMALETTITESYGKPLFVAASRGKLAIGEVKPPAPPAPVKPVAAAPVPAPAKASPPTPAAEAPKPAAAAEKPAEKPVEKPVEKKAVAEKAPEKPAAAAQTPAAPAPAAPVVAISTPAVAAAPPVVEKKAPVPAPAAAASAAPAPSEKKEAAPERATPRAVAPVHVISTPAAPAAVAEKKETVEKHHPAPAAPAAASAPAAPVAAAPAPVAAAPAAPAPQPAAAVAPPAPAPIPAAPVVAAAPPVAAAPSVAAAPATPHRPPTPAPVPTPAVSAPPAPVAPLVPAAAAIAVNGAPTAAPAATAQNTSHSLAALATATEPVVEKKATGVATIEVADRQRKEPRLANPVSQASPKTETRAPEAMSEEDAQAAAGDNSQRPQRWGFWRGNR